MFRRLLHGDETCEQEPIQGGHAYAIIDEIDSVLIDEASSPLILSASSSQPAADAEVYLSAKEAAEQLAAMDLAPELANKNVSYLRSMLHQPARWQEMRDLGGNSPNILQPLDAALDVPEAIVTPVQETSEH